MVSATIGIYDGVHLGHVRVLKEVLKKTGRGIVFLFFKNPKKDNYILTNLKERKKIISSPGLKVILLDIKKFWKMSAFDFFEKILVGRYKVKNLFIGEDFVFGHGKKGTPAHLKRWCSDKKINLRIIPCRKLNGLKISTTRIKACLKKKNIQAANRMLGRCYAVSGRKIKGRGLARTLGFPTVNIKPEKYKILPQGVYLTAVRCSAGVFGALANVGSSPTFGIKNVFELHALPGYPSKVLRCGNFSVSFVKFIRKQKKFKTEKQLAARISKDVKIACKFPLDLIKIYKSNRRRK